jgi:hypothetical protein
MPLSVIVCVIKMTWHWSAAALANKFAMDIIQFDLANGKRMLDIMDLLLSNVDRAANRAILISHSGSLSAVRYAFNPTF